MSSKEEIRLKLAIEAARDGYTLNPDKEMLDDIIEGLATNEERYGYWACPCRMASGDRMADLDIICPCEYRDPDLEEYGRCYCALYVNQKYIDAGMPSDPIPERRPAEKLEANLKVENKAEEQKVEEPQDQDAKKSEADEGEQVKVWRCKVCGYLCAKDEPPRICPICRAKREKFVEFHF